jgi:hypothetical protein
VERLFHSELLLADSRAYEARWRFVPDESGGYMLSVPTGDKWYPEATVNSVRQDGERAVRHLHEKLAYIAQFANKSLPPPAMEPERRSPLSQPKP